MFSTWCYHHWNHRVQTVPTNIAYPQYFSSTRLETGCIYLPWRNPLFSSPVSLRTRQQSKLAHHWAHEIRSVPTKIAAPQYFSPTRLVTSTFHNLTWCIPPGSNLHWHSAEAIGLVLCQQRLLPHSTSLPSARRLATSTFHSLPWCNPLSPLSPLTELAAISIGTALRPQDSCCANKDWSTTVLFFHQPGDWPHDIHVP